MKWMLLYAYRALLRVIRPNSGLTPLSFNRFTHALFKDAPNPLRGTMIDGTPIDVDPSDYHGRILWLFGTNDWKVSRAVNGFLKAGDNFLDIGANYGTIGLMARHKIGPTGHIHLFEPQPELAERLDKAILDGGVSNATVHRVALFDHDDTMTLQLFSNHSGRATIVGAVAGKKNQDEIQVPVKEARAYVAPLVGDRPYGVKIDIEGAEINVLPGLFQARPPTFVVFEGDRSKHELFDFFHENGFEIYGLCRSLLVPKVGLVREFSDWEIYHDFIAIPKLATAPEKPITLKKLASMAGM